jgi:hypothetical protein
MTLIERLESGTEGNEGLDEEIARAAGWHTALGRAEDVWVSPDGDRRYTLPDFSDDIQAAATWLVPDDLPFGVRRLRSGGGAAWVWPSLECEAATPALALCIAALKARGVA